ncbi:hypothetical protein AMJ47_00320 [Parcubacteria bacterium DG_72]|nr:MAG: hypothetical protein AMJ47_00320 [Parcubacteria bacterium DG_72]
MKNIISTFSVILLALAIGLSPSFTFGEITGGRPVEIRLEDILIAVFGIVLIARIFIFKVKKTEKPPLLIPILLWLGVGVLSILTNLIFSSLPLSRAFFYFLKEIEFFFLYFYVFYGAKKPKVILNVWIFLALANIIYVIYQIVSGVRKGEYGTAAIGEWGVLPTGAFFSLIFIFLFNVFLYYFSKLNISFPKKALLGVLCFSPIIGAFGSISQTVVIGVLMAFVLSIFFYAIKSKDIKKFFIIICVFVVISVIFLYFAVKNISYFRRLYSISSFEKIIKEFIRKRWDNVIKPYFINFIKNSSLKDFIIGKGKGFVHEAHNQFLRNLMETGLVGSIAFLILIIAILKVSFFAFLERTDNLSVGLSAGLLIATLTMLFFSMATEAFIVVKPSEVYWFFAGLTMSTLVFIKNNENKRIITTK